MTFRQAQKKYPDAIKAVLTIERRVFNEYNLYKQDVLLEYCSKMFPGNSIIYCSISGYKVTCIYSKEAYAKEAYQRSMVPGSKVRMTGYEGRFAENQKDWTVTHGPQYMCGSLVVWLEGYSGAYACDCLQIVGKEENL